MFPTVSELIHARLKDKSTPTTRKDPYKLAVIAEDGTMRWVVVAGFLSRLEAHGIQADLVLGTSGGGLVCAYYAAGQARQGSMVLSYLSSRGYDLDGKRLFIDPKRLLKNRPAMDLEGMVDIAFTQKIPLNFAALKASPVSAYLTATNRTGETILQPLHDQSKAAIQQAMKNTARIPVLGHSSRDKSVLWDGGLKASIPLQQALGLGATHVLVARCKDNVPPTLWQKVFDIEQLIIKPVLLFIARDLFRLIRKRGWHAAQVLTTLAENQPQYFILGLPHVKLAFGETSEAKLFRQLVEAWHYAGEQLGLPETSLPAEWQPLAKQYLAA